MYTFKERLQYLIDVKKLSQSEVAAGIKVNEARVSDWLTGRVSTPRRTTIIKLAGFFGCDIEWLATGKGEPFPQAHAKSMNITGNKNIQSRGSTEARNVHQNGAGGETMILSNEEAFLINNLRKLQKNDEVLQDLIFQVMQHEREQKKNT